MPGPVADVFVLYGISGDLAHKLLFPALYQMTLRNELDVPVVGVALTDWTRDDMLESVRKAIQAKYPLVDEGAFAALADRLSLVRGDYSDESTFQNVAIALAEKEFALHYLAIPPKLFATVAKGIAKAG